MSYAAKAQEHYEIATAFWDRSLEERALGDMAAFEFSRSEYRRHKRLSEHYRMFAVEHFEDHA